MHAHPLSEDSPDRLARRRAGAKLGWYIHACAYLCVNLLLAMLAAASGRHWAIFPALGWGLGLAVHGFAVYARCGGGWFERMVRNDHRRLNAAQQR